MDIHQRWILDMGLPVPGPDAGKGGKRLLLPPGPQRRSAVGLQRRYFGVTYGPEQAAFDGSWKPGDFEQVGNLRVQS